MDDEQSHHFQNDFATIESSVEESLVDAYREKLELIAFDQLRGVDIKAVYPQFFEDQSAYPRLRVAFEELRELLQAERPNIKPPIAQLAFLNSTEPIIKCDKNGQWKALWSLSKRYLQNRFEQISELEPAAVGPAFRDAPQAADDQITTLLYQQYQLSGRIYDLWLRLVADESEGFTFQPQVIIRPTDGGKLPSHYQVVMTWGAYQAAAPLTHDGLVNLPKLLGDTVFNEDDTLLASLTFKLQPE